MWLMSMPACVWGVTTAAGALEPQAAPTTASAATRAAAVLAARDRWTITTPPTLPRAATTMVRSYANEALRGTFPSGGWEGTGDLERRAVAVLGGDDPEL